MMNSTNDKSRDIQEFLKKIKESGEEDKFKDMLNKMPIAQKVDNFLRENQPTEFMQEIQGYVDPRTGKVTREDQIAGLPFPYNPAGLPEDVYQATQRQYGKKIFGPYTTDDARLIQDFFGNRKGLGWPMFSKQYRERYKDALKLQRWPLVDTRKMEKEKKEKARQARLRRLYGLKDDEQLKT